MRCEDLSQRAHDLVLRAVQEATEPEFDQILVGEALVIREGSHYRIEAGGESWSELQDCARRRDGVCDCGSPLSSLGNRHCCRTCGREFRF